VEIRLLDLAVHDADLAIALPLLGLLAPIVRSRLNELAAVALGHEPTRLRRDGAKSVRGYGPTLPRPTTSEMSRGTDIWL
jgi:hypothetical protein